MTKKANRSTIVMRVHEDEAHLIEKYRAHRSALEKECEQAGIDSKTVKHYWYKSELFSIFAKPNEKSLDDLKAKIIKDMDKFSPKYPKLPRLKLQDPHLLVIDPADIHIGKLASHYETGDEYNSNIAVKRVKDGVKELIRYSYPYNVEKIVLILGNDILHTDTPKRTTTSGTPQDTDGMWYDNFLLARDLYIDVIEQLMAVADVHVIHNVSNHDYMTGWMLSQTIYSWFRKSKNVTFDIDMRHRKGYVYGSNLICTTHGDGAKEADLPLLMAREFKKEWAETEHHYIYKHHVHHKTAKEYMGVTVETSRSASGADSWHHRNGYQHAKKAIEAYLHHPSNGQVARFTHVF